MVGTRWGGRLPPRPPRYPPLRRRHPPGRRATRTEADATLAARTILQRFVAPARRFRDCAVLVRDLEGCHQAIARGFRRYGIPFFWTGVNPSPTTRWPSSPAAPCAPWRWTGGTRIGSAPSRPAFPRWPRPQIDRLENEALARGWHGKKWREPIQSSDRRPRADLGGIGAPTDSAAFSATGPAALAVNKSVPPAANWRRRCASCGGRSTVEETPGAMERRRRRQAAIHRTVREQMNAWLDNVDAGVRRRGAAVARLAAHSGCRPGRPDRRGDSPGAGPGAGRGH